MTTVTADRAWVMGTVQNTTVTATASLAGAPANNSIVCVCCYYRAGSVTVATPTDNFGDSGGGAWTINPDAPKEVAAGQLGSYMWYRVIGTGASGAQVSVAIATGSGAKQVAVGSAKADVACTWSVDDTSGAFATTNTVIPGNLTLSGSGGWWIVGHGAWETTTQTPATGYTQQVNSTPFNEHGVEDKFTSTNGTEAPNWALGASERWASTAAAFKATAVGPQVTGGTAAPVHQSTGNTITGTGFGASQTGSAASVIGGVGQTETAWADTSITYTADRGINGNGIAVNVVVTDSAGVSGDPYALTGFQPPAGWTSVTLVSVEADPTMRLQSSADLAIGNQIEWDDATIEVTDSGVPIWPPGTPAGYTFNFRVWVSGDGWGATEVATLNPASAGGAGTTGRRRMQLKLGF